MDDGRTIARCVVRARTPGARMRGLLGRTPAMGEALALEPAKQVHTFGMRAPIDVVFCDRELRVLYVARSMKPNRVGRFVWSARYAFEMGPGGAGPVEPGDRLAFVSRTGDSSDRSRRVDRPHG
jgi:uncharacterized protein